MEGASRRLYQFARERCGQDRTPRDQAARVIGGILGGKSGAATGAAVGGGAGTGVVLATKGKEVRLGPGTDVTTRLTAPVTVRVSRN